MCGLRNKRMDVTLPNTKEWLYGLLVRASPSKLVNGIIRETDTSEHDSIYYHTMPLLIWPPCQWPLSLKHRKSQTYIAVAASDLKPRPAYEMYGINKRPFSHGAKYCVHSWQGYRLSKKVHALFHHTYVNSKQESGGNISLQGCFQHLQLNGSFKSRCSMHACLRSKFPWLQLGDNLRQACLEAFLSHWSTFCCCL